MEINFADRVTTVIFEAKDHNSLNVELYTELAELFERGVAGQVIVLRSDSKHFCTGQNLDEFKKAEREGTVAQLLEAGVRAITGALKTDALIVAEVGGAAVGAGALLAFCADLIVVDDNAWFSLPELKLGMPIGLAVAERLLGVALSWRMLLTTDKISAQQLYDIGVAKRATVESLEGDVKAIVQEMLVLPSNGVQRLRSSSADQLKRLETAQLYEAEVSDYIESLKRGAKNSGVNVI